MEILQKQQISKCRQQVCELENYIIDDLQKKITQFVDGNREKSVEKSVEKCADCIEFIKKFEDLKIKYVEKEKLLDESQKEIATLKETVAWLIMQKEEPIPLMTSPAVEIKKEIEGCDGNVEEVMEESDGNVEEVMKESDGNVEEDIEDSDGNYQKDIEESDGNVEEDIEESDENFQKEIEESDENIQKDTEQKFVCTFPGCPKVYKYKKALKDHWRMSHPNETWPYETFSCNYPDCKLSFQTERRLNMHRKAHIKPFQCTVDGCNEGFGDKQSLDEHLGAHRDKPFACPFNCGKYFARRFNMTYHMRAHAGKKPFECPHEGCGKSFSSASNCATHKLRVHDGVRPFQCEFEGCGRRFSSSQECKFHSYSHTGEKHFKCHVCYGEYKSVNGLRKHMVKTHNLKSRPCKLKIV